MNKMLSRSTFPLIFTLFLCNVFADGEKEKLRISADNSTYVANNTLEKKVDEKKVFEDWANLTFGYGDFELHLAYEAHLPPPSWSYQQFGQGIYERSISFTRDNLGITVGNFYPLLGRGITYRSFQKREMRYVSNIDGVECTFANNYLDVKLFGGLPSDFSGKRLNLLKAGEVKIIPVKWGAIGLTYVASKLPSSPEDNNWGSVYSEVQGDWGNVYLEAGSLDFFKNGPNDSLYDNFLNGEGTALYLTSNIFLYDLAMLFEMGYYNNFDISQGIKVYNSPPPAIKEHSYSLMSRAIPTFAADNHAGLHASFTYSINENNNISLDISRVRARDTSDKKALDGLVHGLDFVNNQSDYADYFLSAVLSIPEGIDWAGGAGIQLTKGIREINLAASADLGLAKNLSAQLVVEHQHTTFEWTKKMYYSQLYSVTLAHSSKPRLALSFIGERTTDQLSEKKFWPGLQVNWSFLKNKELVLFAGSRKKGKICSGGVCVNKPEFTGAELTFSSSF